MSSGGAPPQKEERNAMRFHQECRTLQPGFISGKYRRVFSSLLIGLTGLMILPTTAFAVVENVTPFTWSMPDRLLVNNSVGGGAVPQFDSAVEIIPADGWTVNFDACGVSTSAIVSYQLAVDGVTVATVAGCEFAHQFPEEGMYQVALTVTDNTGDTAVINETITVQDWLIIAMGDSYGSGEGNPIAPLQPQAHIDFSVLRNLATNVWNDFQDAAAQLPGLEEAQATAQQLRDDALTTRDQAAEDLARLQQNLQDLIQIRNDVENEPEVIFAQNNLINAQQWVNSAQAAYNAALADYNNCTFLNCVTRLAILTAATAELEAAQANLIVAEAALWTARTEAVIRLSIIASIQDFDALTLAIDAATLARNAAQNTLNLAQNAYNNAQAALQQAIDAVASLQSVIGSLEQAWFEARFNALEQYLHSLPTWTAVPPSWGTAEPSYYDVVMNFEDPGNAMRCHRSMHSGQARAALALEQMDPHTSVTFIHLSCSGATIEDGLVNAYGAQPLFSLNGMVWPDGGGLIEGQSIEEALPHLANLPAVPSQISEARTIITQGNTAIAREIDAVVISIGGNDISFSGMIESCMFGEPCHIEGDFTPSAEFTEAQALAMTQNCYPFEFINFLTGQNLQTDFFSFTDLCLSIYDNQTATAGAGAATFETNVVTTHDIIINDVLTPVTQFEEQFINLKNTLDGELPQLATTNSHRVYFTEYPNPTGNIGGVYCGWEYGQATTVGEELKNLPGVTQPEIIWADTIVAAALRDETSRFVTEKGWKFISNRVVDSDTIGTASRRHGYCADEHWVVRIPESLVNQGDHLGAVHPNALGHDNYAIAIYQQLIADLYPAGAEQPPRPPEEPTLSNSPSPGGGGGGGGGSLGWLTLLVLAGFGMFRRKI